MAGPQPAADHKKPAGTAPAAAKEPAPAAGKAAQADSAKAPAAGRGQSGAASASSQRFDRMAVRAKLAVSEPGDAVEREADQVADRVMRAPSGDAKSGATGGSTPTAKPPQEGVARAPQQAAGDAKPASSPPVPQSEATSNQARGGAASNAAKPASGTSPNEVKREAAAPTREAPGSAPASAPAHASATTQPSAPTHASGSTQPPAPAHASAATLANAPSSHDEIKRKTTPPSETSQPAADQPGTLQELAERLGSGQPLDAGVRAEFESRLSRDLSDVRIHTDEAAEQTARQLAARAFTFGNHIAFAQGEYRPESEAGKRLLAHELAHVLQQANGAVPRMIMRDSAAPPAAAPGTDEFKVTHADLEIPPIKSRHGIAYQGRAAEGALRRKGAYDASKRGTKQEKIWTDNAKPKIDKIPASQRPSTTSGLNLNLNVAGGTKVKSIPVADEARLLDLLKIPTWDAAGDDVKYQVDHMVEFQLGGEDLIANMELLNQAHNGSVGSSFSHGIKRTVREEIQADPKNPALLGYSGPRSAAGEPTPEGVMEAKTVVFKRVVVRARESKREESGSTTWSLEQINTLRHVLPLLSDGEYKSSATNFALLSPTANLLIAQFAHANDQLKIPAGANQSASMAGFTMKEIALRKGYNDIKSGEIGTLHGTLDLGPKVAMPPGEVSVQILQAKSPGEHSGKIGITAQNLPAQADFTPMSPLKLSGITLGKSVFGGAELQPKHPALSGLKVPAQIRNGRLGLFYTVDAGFIKDKLKIPGVNIDSAAVTFGYDGSEFMVEGGVEFTINKFGTGNLNASIDTAGDFQLEGGLRADTRLFDRADMKVWYRSKGGFGGKGTLAINAGKVKGIKSAQITAAYEDSVLSASGNVEPDIPGLQSAQLTVSYAKETLQITGKLAIDKKVPGVKSADITVSVTQDDKGWKVAATGDVIPNIPGLPNAELKFKYDEGFVLVEGEFHLKKGPLDGKVTAGVTNAKVDKDGKRDPTGSGSTFVMFGTADIEAEFIKDKLKGTLNLRLLPDGSVRVGGVLTVPEFEVFGKFPKGGGEFFNQTFPTPSIPVPGLGFAVGSVTVGVTFSASVTAKAHASIGPGKLLGIKVKVDDFDPATASFDTLSIGGEGSFVVYADAGMGIGAKLNLEFGAAIVKVKGSIGAEASAGIPADKPILSATSHFTYSHANGLDIKNQLDLNIEPELKFRLFGEVSADLNLLIDTVTVWSKDWTLAEANYKLPVSIKASGDLGYNSKTGKITPERPQDAIKVEQPKLDANVMKDVAMGNPAPAAVKTLDKNRKEVSDEDQLMCTPVKSRNFTPARSKSAVSSTPNQSVMPKREPGGEDPPLQNIDESMVASLGAGFPLDLATRGFFEQRMGADFSAVRIFIGPQADRAAHRISARAFTVGQRIVFADGQYDPDSEQGKALLAHELAHVRQQASGATRMVMREASTSAPASPPVPAAAPAPAPAPVPAAGGAGTTGTVASAGGPEYRVATPLAIPPIKARHSPTYQARAEAGTLRRPRGYDSSTRGTAQVAKWLAGVKIEPRTRIPANYHPAPGSPWKLPLQKQGGATAKVITAADDATLRNRLKRPDWDAYAEDKQFQVDHMIEFQLGGQDATENLELLDQAHNGSVGSSFNHVINRAIAAELKSANKLPAAAGLVVPASPTVAFAKENYAIVFTSVQVRGNESKKNKEKDSRFWSLAAINDLEHVTSLLPGDQGNMAGSPQQIVLQSPTGALVIGRFPVAGNALQVRTAQGSAIAGFTIDAVNLDASGGPASLVGTTIAAGKPVGQLEGTLDLGPGVTFPPNGNRRSLGLVKANQQYAVRIGATEVPGPNSGTPNLVPATFHPLSPMEITNLTYGRSVFARAAIQPTHPALAGLRIPAEIRNGRLGIYYTIDATSFAERLRVPGLKVDSASITLGYDGDAFSVAGGAEFTIRNFGTGSLDALLDDKGRFQLEGAFHADTRLFDRADMRIWYRSEGGFGGTGTLAITNPNKIRGIRNASVNATYDSGVFTAAGTVQPNIPGVQNASLTVRYGPDESGADSLQIAGDLALAAGIPGLDEGKVHVALVQREEAWHVSAKGDLTPHLPGLNPVIKVSYDDGLFTGETNAHFARSIFTGDVTVGLTNRAVSPEGELSGTEPGDRLLLYGAGNLNARVTDWLQGGVGVKVKPSGKLLISGKIGIPAAVTVFDQFPSRERATRELFHMPTLSIPIFGFAVGGNVVGVALTISGRVTGHAFVGPGQLTQAEIIVVDFDPAEPDSLHLTGRAQFNLPGEAGVDAALDAGVSAGAAVVRITAGVSVTAGAAVRATATPSVDLDWKPATGLHLHADLQASLSPRLRFGVNGYAEVVADAFVTSFTLWRKDWKLAEREFGSSLALGLNAPVDYYSDARGLVFDPSRVTFQVPTLNADTFKQLLSEGGG